MVTIALRFILSLSNIFYIKSFFISAVIHGTLHDRFLICRIRECLSSTSKNSSFQQIHFELVSVSNTIRSHGMFKRSSSNLFIFLTSIFFAFLRVFKTGFIFLTPSIILWSLMPVCITPDRTIFSGVDVI